MRGSVLLAITSSLSAVVVCAAFFWLVLQKWQAEQPVLKVYDYSLVKTVDAASQGDEQYKNLWIQWPLKKLGDCPGEGALWAVKFEDEKTTKHLLSRFPASLRKEVGLYVFPYPYGDLPKGCYSAEAVVKYSCYPPFTSRDRLQGPDFCYPPDSEVPN